MLEELDILLCTQLIEILESFGDITSLKHILVWESRRLIESALKIKEDVTENMGEDNLEVLYNGILFYVIAYKFINFSYIKYPFRICFSNVTFNLDDLIFFAENIVYK